MVDMDSAFLWETEALRSAPPKEDGWERAYEGVDRDDSDWLSLRQANAITGIPIPTLRKWARRESVPTYLEETPVGQLRMVSLRGIYQRADDLGRVVKGRPPRPVEVDRQPPEKPPVSVEPPMSIDIASKTPPREEPAIPEGTMLVPLDAWNKLLMQLGNLHEAGQQLAEARERAAKAETEAGFLKERLAETRIELVAARSVAPPTDVPADDAPPEPISHIPIESPDDSNEGDSGEDIPVRDLGTTQPPEESAENEVEPEPLGLTAYSVEMMKHLYATWRGRPRR